MLSSMHDYLIGEYEIFQNAKDMWDQLKFDFGGTSTTRLRSLVLSFEVYRKDPKHTMNEHFRMMSGIIRDLKAAGNVLTDEQQVQAIIRSVDTSFCTYQNPESSVSMAILSCLLKTNLSKWAREMIWKKPKLKSKPKSPKQT